MLPNEGLKERSVIAVTVTYGNRKTLLIQVMEALRSVGLKRMVVVDNGATWPVSAQLTEEYLDFIDVVELGKNTGSAMGFSAGIQRALDLGAEYVWLLDDDTRPRDGTLRELLAVYFHEIKSTPRDYLVALAFRPERQTDVIIGVSAHHISPRSDSFRGFHVLDIPYKIWSRTPWKNPRVGEGLPATVLMHTAPYGGLLFHRDLVKSIGLPNLDFVLYEDDSEFTYRITRKGGRIVLVTEAILDDLETSWNINGKVRIGNGFASVLRGSGDFRAYYGMRNGVYLDATNMKKNTFIFWLNRTVYISLLFVFSVVFNKHERYQLLQRAIRDGLAGQLGVNERFPL